MSLRREVMSRHLHTSCVIYIDNALDAFAKLKLRKWVWGVSLCVCVCNCSLFVMDSASLCIVKLELVKLSEFGFSLAICSIVKSLRVAQDNFWSFWHKFSLSLKKMSKSILFFCGFHLSLPWMVCINLSSDFLLALMTLDYDHLKQPEVPWSTSGNC